MKTLSIVLFVFAAIFSSCDLNELSGTNNETEKTASLEFSISLAKAPVEIMSMSGFLSRSGEDTIEFDFTIQKNNAYCKIQEIKPGDWELMVNAYNSNHVIIYTGLTKVKIEPGVETKVYLHLDPTTGTLRIVVTWGEDSEKMILMAQNSNNEWRVITLNTDGTGFTDITNGRYPFWINNKIEFIFLSEYRTINKYDVKNHKITYLNETPYSVNFLRYSKSLNRILCDFHMNYNRSYWHIGYMDLNGNNFQEVKIEDSWKKRPVTREKDDWIYFHSNISGENQIHRIKPDGSSEEHFINNNFSCETPSFSYDGKKLIYSAVSQSNSISKIIVHDMDTNSEEIFDFSNVGKVMYPSFTKDGKYIIYIIIIGPEDTDRKIFRMKVNGTEKTQLTSNLGYHHYARPILW